VKVFALSLGGQRLEDFKQEMAAQWHDDYVIVTQPKSLDKNWKKGNKDPSFQSDYPISRGEASCTRAHLAFAWELKASGEDCALVAEDDASFLLSSYWPVSLRDLCDGMSKFDPKWTTLQVYQDGSRVRGAKLTGLKIDTYPEGVWGTVAYLATQKWADDMIRLSHNNTRLMKADFMSEYGVADSALYHYKGANEYLVTPGLFFPNNVAHGTTVVASGKSRDLMHMGIADKIIGAMLMDAGNNLAFPGKRKSHP